MRRPAVRLTLWLCGLLLIPCIGLAVAFSAGCSQKPIKKQDSRPRAQEEASKPTLDKNEREYLWQAEHHHLLLGRYGFTPFAEALSQGNADKIRWCMASGFVAQIPSH